MNNKVDTIKTTRDGHNLLIPETEQFSTSINK